MNPNTMNEIIQAVRHAREKHRFFAISAKSALPLAMEELGELAKAINDNRPWAEIEGEALDTIAVLVRLIERDGVEANSMTVKIEMEIPKGCKNCRGLVSASICVLADDVLIKPIKDEDWDKRPSWCPLQEVKE